MSLSCKPSIGWTRSVQSWAFRHHLVYVVPAIQLPAGLLVCWTSLHVSKWNLRQHKYNESTKCSAKHDSYASCWAITKCGVFATLLSNPANEVNNVAVLWCWQFLIQYSLCSWLSAASVYVFVPAWCQDNRQWAVHMLKKCYLVGHFK